MRKKKCPNCGNYSTHKMGKLVTKAKKWQRYRCTDCGQTFSRDS